MIKFIMVLLLIFVALLLGHNLVGYEGRVVIATESHVVELTLISAIIICFFAVIGFWVLEWLFKRIVRTLMGSKNWFGTLSRRQQNKAFYKALNAFLVGDISTAKQSVEKSFGGDFHGANYLLASELHKDNANKAARMLAHAETESTSFFAATLKQAQLHLKEFPQKALDVLSVLSTKEQQHQSVVMLKLSAFSLLNQWTDVKDLINQHKKVLGTAYIEWAQKATHGEFAEIASKSGANALKDKWTNLSRAARKDIANQICYVQLLIDQGLSKDAEVELVAFANKQAHPAFTGLFKQLKHSDPSTAIKFIENKIKQTPKTPEYYSVLAHLSYNSGDFSLAQRAINKALELRRSNEDALLLAAILEQQSSFEQANVLYKKLLA